MSEAVILALPVHWKIADLIKAYVPFHFDNSFCFISPQYVLQQRIHAGSTNCQYEHLNISTPEFLSHNDTYTFLF